MMGFKRRVPESSDGMSESVVESARAAARAAAHAVVTDAIVAESGGKSLSTTARLDQEDTNNDDDNDEVDNSSRGSSRSKSSHNNNTESADAGSTSENDDSTRTKMPAYKRHKNDNQNDFTATELQQQQHQQQSSLPPIKLYKNSRFSGYLTLALASFINYDAAVDSNHKSTSINVSVPSLGYQQRYAMATSLVSLIISLFLIIISLDRVTPLETVWMKLLQPGSKFELVIAAFLVLWWTIAVGLETSVAGIAGDGKGQYSLYYSTWACCVTSYSLLERWWVSAGWSSFKSFIASWPHRSPAWILISGLSFLTLLWYVDLRRNSQDLNREEERFNRQHFDSITNPVWQIQLIVISFTFIPSTCFVLAELFRDTNADGSIQNKSKVETIVEGICFLVIALMWIPTVMVATTPGGAASLIGNAYFFSWMLVVFIFEGVVWFIHDLRKEQHQILKRKEIEYRNRQRKILEQTIAIRNQNQLTEWEDNPMIRKDFDSNQLRTNRHMSSDDYA